MKTFVRLVTLTLLTFSLGTLTACEESNEKKPLKVYILAGQSNMQGHAMVTTFERMKLNPKQAEFLKEIQNSEGKALELDDVRISAIGLSKDDNEVATGKLTTGFGARGRGEKIGPEYTFGIYMNKALKEPILIIKTAWGGKSLYQDFRSPSAGVFKLEGKETDPKVSGKYYRLMIKHIKTVLADINQEYEISGFAWFQGWNDMVNRGVYPNRSKPDGYASYGKVLCHFIRDVRKDLSAPEMPFVIGVMGTDGLATKESEEKKQKRYRGIAPAFRTAMAYPATLDEFKGNVTAVKTGKYWDVELSQLLERQSVINEKVKKEVGLAKGTKLSSEEQKAQRKKENELREKLMAKEFTENERKVLATGKSNAGYHYNGSALTMAGIGKGFAEAMLEFK
jgi:alpha-galactosidase